MKKLLRGFVTDLLPQVTVIQLHVDNLQTDVKRRCRRKNGANTGSNNCYVKLLFCFWKSCFINECHFEKLVWNLMYLKSQFNSSVLQSRFDMNSFWTELNFPTFWSWMNKNRRWWWWWGKENLNGEPNHFQKETGRQKPLRRTFLCSEILMVLARGRLCWCSMIWICCSLADQAAYVFTLAPANSDFTAGYDLFSLLHVELSVGHVWMSAWPCGKALNNLTRAHFQFCQVITFYTHSWTKSQNQGGN